MKNTLSKQSEESQRKCSVVFAEGVSMPRQKYITIIMVRRYPDRQSLNIFVLNTKKSQEPSPQ